jgi:hypothetical protein
VSVLAAAPRPVHAQVLPPLQASSELIPYRKGTQWGFCDRTKRLVIPVKYDNASRFVAGLARVQIGGKWGCVNVAGQETVPLQYEWLESFEQGVAFVKRGGKWGAVDTSGKERVEPAFEELRVLYSPANSPANSPRTSSLSAPALGLVYAVKRDGKWGVADANGKELLAPKYESIGAIFRGCATVKLAGKIGAIGAIGAIDANAAPSAWREIAAAVYDQVSAFQVVSASPASTATTAFASTAFASVEQNGKFGLVDAQWTVVVPVRYDNVSTVSEGLIAVQTRGKWGFVSVLGASAGKEVVQLLFDKVADFSGGYARVQRGGKWGFINTDGAEFWED